MAALMAGLWWVQRRTHNAGIVDIAWSFGTALCAVGFAALSANGDHWRRWAVALMAGLWGIRLGSFLSKRVLSHAEDGRYTMLREKWGRRTQPMMFGFYQVQALWAVMFALPMLAAARNRAPFGIADVAAIGIWAVAVTGETIADVQLARFTSGAHNKGHVFRAGLWSWSRHPNYFFEWLQWWAYVLFATGSPMAWIAWAGMLIMLLFITKVTGISMTEARALQTRGEEYRRYQREVSPFVPLPPQMRKRG